MLLNSPKKLHLDQQYHHRPTAREEILSFFPDLGKTLPKIDVGGWTVAELRLWLRNKKDENKNK